MTQLVVLGIICLFLNKLKKKKKKLATSDYHTFTPGDQITFIAEEDPAGGILGAGPITGFALGNLLGPLVLFSIIAVIVAYVAERKRHQQPATTNAPGDNLLPQS